MTADVKELREQVCNRIIKLFYPRKDVYARSYLKLDGSMGYAPACAHESFCTKGSKCMYWVPQAITKEIVYKHLSNKEMHPTATIGTYGIGRGNLSNWICWDVDGHNGELQDARVTISALASTLLALGIPFYTEDSGRGYHIWIFSLGMESRVAYKAGKFIVQETARILRKPLPRPVEVYPKQSATDSFGNLVKVPLGLHYSGKRCYFVDPFSFLVLQNQYTDVLMGIKTVTEQKLIELAVRYEETHRSPVALPIMQLQEDVIYAGPPCTQLMFDARLRAGEGRNNILFQLVINLRRSGFHNQETIKNILWEWNEQNTDPMDAQEFNNTLRSAMSSNYSWGCRKDHMEAYCLMDQCPVGRDILAKEEKQFDNELARLAYKGFRLK